MIKLYVVLNRKNFGNQMKIDNEAVIMKQINDRLAREAPRVDEPSREEGVEGLLVGEVSKDVLSRDEVSS